MRKKIALMVLVLIMLFSLASCVNEDNYENKYHAVILDSSSPYLKGEYFELTFDVKPETESSDEWRSDEDDGWWNYSTDGKTLIHKKTLVIKEQSSADNLFANFPSDFDFEAEMLEVCFLPNHRNGLIRLQPMQ